MTCQHRDTVGALLLGALGADEALAAEEHLLQCEECAAERRELAIVRTILDTVQPSEHLDQVPARLGDDVVARLMHTPHRDRRRDMRLVLLGVAAAALLLVGGQAIVRAVSGTSDHGHDLELVGPAIAPDAWAIATLHPRVDGTIVDLEVGALPTDGSSFSVTVRGTDKVLAQQTFVANSDGWAQVLLATSRPMQHGDVIEVSRSGAGTSEPVLRCNCAA